MTAIRAAHIGADAPPARGGSRRFALVAALSLFVVACGGGEADTSETSPTVGPATQNAADDDDSGDARDDGADEADSESAADDAESASTGDESAAGDPDSAVEMSYGVAEVDLPPGVELFPGENQSVTFGQASYVVTGQADGLRLIAVRADGAANTDAVIVDGRSAKVFNSGTQVVLAGSDGAGDLVVLSSDDGVTFVETRIPPPQRFAEADVWQVTSLVGDVLGVADLNGGLFMIGSQGINWPFDSGLVAQYGYSVSDEVGDAATRAGVVRQAPKGDGDMLYTFVVDSDVVFEALGSEAGLEPGYREASQAAREAETSFVGGWTISGSTATPTSQPPLMGGLQEDVRLNALYPSEDGVVAIVTDFAAEGPIPMRAPVVDGDLVTALATQVGIFSYGSPDGIDWSKIGTLWGPTRGVVPGVDIVGDPSLEPVEISTLFSDGTLTLFNPDGTVIWEGPDWSRDYPDLPAGSPPDVLMIHGGYLIVQPPLEPGGELRAFEVAQAEDGSTTAAVIEVTELPAIKLPRTAAEVDGGIGAMHATHALLLMVGAPLDATDADSRIESYSQFLADPGR